MSPNCVHQPSSIVPAAGTRSDCWGGTSGGRWAGGSYRDLPKPQLSGSSDFSSLGSPILIQGNHLKRERRQPKPLLSAALTLAGAGEAWPCREAPGCGWNGHFWTAPRPAQVSLSYLARLREGRGRQAPVWLERAEIRGALGRLRCGLKPQRQSNPLRSVAWDGSSPANHK